MNALKVDMENLNTISGLKTGIKITSLDALKNVNDYYGKYTGTQAYKFMEYPVDRNRKFSFRIKFECGDHPCLGANNYGMKYQEGTETITKNGWLYAFSDAAVIDAYISTAIELICKQYEVKNISLPVVNFITSGLGKANFDYSLREYIFGDESLNANFLQIIVDILRNLGPLWLHEWGFNHGNLTPGNIVRCEGSWVVANFGDSSIFFNGIRFANGQTDVIPEYFPKSEEVDVIKLLKSMLCYPRVVKSFMLNDEYKNFYSNINLKQISDILEFIDKNIPDLQKKEAFLADLHLDKSAFDAKYLSSKWTMTGSYNTYYGSVQLYDILHLAITKYRILINAVIIDTDNIFSYLNIYPSAHNNDDAPYRRFKHYYFQLSNVTATNTEHHLCLTGCDPNANKCQTLPFKWGMSTYLEDACTVYPNITSQIQYEIISKTLTYYDINGNLNIARLNSDPNWRTLLSSILESGLFSQHFDCSANFIAGAKQLPKNSASISIQYVNINLGNINNTLALKYSSDIIDNFVNSITDENDLNEKYMLKPLILKLITDLLGAINKNVFAKINANYERKGDNKIDNSSDKTALSNQYIKAEGEIYAITNKLLNGSFTPNIASMLLNLECPTGSFYDNIIVQSKRADLKLKDYFSSQGGTNWQLKSYKIFILELLQGSVTLDEFLTSIDQIYDGANFEDDLQAIMVQIAYTLECFKRIGLVHNDLHSGNIFIEKLDQPTNFNYVITDGADPNYIKNINVVTRYFVRIFDFDRSFIEDSVASKKLNIVIPKVVVQYKDTNSDIADDMVKLFKYDFYYVTRWMLYESTKIQSNKGDAIRHALLPLYADPQFAPYESDPAKDVYHRNINDIMYPIDFLKGVRDTITTTIRTSAHIADVKIDYNSYIYVLPDADFNKLHNAFELNNDWNNISHLNKIKICKNIVGDIEVNKIVDILKNMCRNKSKRVSIDWVRHAESCSNFDSQTNVDRELNANRDYGYAMTGGAMAGGAGDYFTGIKSRWYYEPNLSYIGIQQAIFLGEKYLKGHNYNAIFCSPLSRTIMTSMIALRANPHVTIYVTPFISEIQNIFSYVDFDNQNTAVASNVLKKRIKFVKSWMEKNWIDNFDDIEIMTDLIHVRDVLEGAMYDDLTRGQIGDAFILRAKNMSEVTEEITSVLNYKPEILRASSDKNILREDYAGKYRGRKSIIALIQEIIEKFDRENVIDDFINKYSLHAENSFVQFKRGAKVDFSILEEYERIYKSKRGNKDTDAEDYNPRNPNIYKFYTEILPSKIDLNRENTVACISHGSLIRYIWKEKDLPGYKVVESYLKHMKNTHTFRERIDYDNAQFQSHPEYDPVLIREAYQNIEALNVDICRTQSIKGIINYNLKEPAESYTGTLFSRFSEARDYLIADQAIANKSFDVQFFNDAEYSADIGDSVLVGGNYYRKYMKYKTKYIQKKLKKV